MEENELYDRIGETDLNPTYKDGQPYMHTDINQMLGILKTAINENYYDIQRLLNGAKTVGNANQLDGATLSRYIDEELQADDNKIPSSQQAKAYMDALFAGFSAPVRGVDYWTEDDKQQVTDDAYASVMEEITPELEEALAEKADIDDVTDKINEVKEEINTIAITHLNLKHLFYKDISDEDLYNSLPHQYLQGFCIVNNNILFALVNESHLDNTTRLIEVNKQNGQIVRELYGNFYHANSMSYRKDTNEIYIAYCNTSQNGNTIANNTIGVIDYTTLQLKREINVNNLGSYRIRSCYYDNENKILYGADVYNIFEIDEDTQSISKNIELNTDTIDTAITNQTFKRFKNMFVGIFVDYIGVWNLEGELLKICSINQIQEGLRLGELEDFDINEDGTFIIGTSHRDSSRDGIRTSEFLITDIIKNYKNKGIPSWDSGADTARLTVYVDNTSLQNTENGSETYPFKSLQRAISFAKYWNKGTTIILKGSSYPYTFIQSNSDLYIECRSNIEIETLVVTYSNVDINCTSGNTLQINKGLRTQRANMRFNGGANTYKIIASSGNENNAIRAINSHITILNCEIDSNNIGDGLYSSYSTILLKSCTFNNYVGFYGIRADNCSIINPVDNTFTEEISSTQNNILVMNGSNVYNRSGLKDKYNYRIVSQGRIYPSYSTLASNDISNQFFGEVCDADTHYTHAILNLIIPGTGTYYKNVIIPLLDDTSNIIVDGQWINNERIFNSCMNITVENGKIKIKENRTLWRYYNDNVNHYSVVSTQAEAEAATNSQLYLRIRRVSFIML